MTYENFFGYAINILLVMISIIIFVGILQRICKNRFARIKSCYATVCSKENYFEKTFFKTDSAKTKQRFSVTFLCDDKKVTFFVSELSYKNYAINQTGILKYRGNKLIDFS